MSDQKKIRAFYIQSNMSRHEIPKQLKKNIFKYPQIFEKNTESQNRKMLDQKKNRAFHIHSNMSRHEMPKQLKKKLMSPKILSPKMEKCWTKKIRHSTQR